MTTKTLDLNAALNKMPSKFTSNQFTKVAKRYGLKDIDISRGKVSGFLHKHCSQINLRTWVKRPAAIMHDELTEQHCIDFLKSRGYKVQAQTWTDL